MQNNIQVGLTQPSVLQEIKHKKQEEIKSIEVSKTSTLDTLDNVSANVTLNKSGILDINNSKGFLELSKASVQNIEDGISKLNDLNNAFNSLEVGHDDRINILNRSNEIIKDIQDSTKNTSYNEKSVSQTSSHNIGSQHISIGSNNKQEDAQAFNLESVDQAIEILMKSKEQIEAKMNVLNDFITKEEGSINKDVETKMTQQELDIIQENLRNQNELFSISHNANNKKMASLFF